MQLFQISQQTTCVQILPKIRLLSFTEASTEAAVFHESYGDDYFPLPVQWEVVNKKWSKYQVPPTGGGGWAAFYPADNMHRATGPSATDVTRTAMTFTPSK